MTMPERNIKRLTEELFVVRFEDIMSESDKELDKLNRQTKKDMKTIFYPLLISAILSLITVNALFVAIGAAYVGLRAIIRMTKEMIEDTKRFLKPIDIESESQNEVKRYAEYKKMTRSLQEADYLKENYQAVIEGLSLRKNNQVQSSNILTEEEIKKRIIYEYECMCLIYTLPPMSVKDNEWDILLESFKKQIKGDEIEEKLYGYLSSLLRYTLASVLLHGDRLITIDSFIESIPLLAKLNSEELKWQEIIADLNSKKGQSEIIDLNSYRLQKQARSK